MAITTALSRVTEIIRRPSFYKIMQGGASAGKTYAIMTALLTGWMPSNPGTVTTVVGQTYGQLSDGAIRDMRAILREVNFWHPEMWNSSSKTLTFPNGSILEFRSVDNMTARGPRRNVLFVNEANGISFETFQELATRTKDFVVIDFNPSAKFWAHEELLEKQPDRTDFEIFTYKDNEAIGEMELENILQHAPKKGEKPSNWWRVYGLGQIGELEGNIYSGWVEDSAYRVRMDKERVRYGLDFGFGHPTALVSIYEYADGRLGVVEEIYQTGIPASGYPEALKAASVDPTVPIIADAARPEIIADLRAAGYRIAPANKDAGSVARGIMRVQESTIVYAGKHIRAEYLAYHWRKKRSTGEVIYEPEKTDDDAMDAIRYAIDDLKSPKVGFSGVR